MPTTRPRHPITETDAIAAAIDDAARHWPDEPNRGRLLQRLIREGHAAIEREHDERAARQRLALRRTSGAFTNAYHPGYLDELREEWPE